MVLSMIFAGYEGQVSGVIRSSTRSFIAWLFRRDAQIDHGIRALTMEAIKVVQVAAW